MSKCVNSISGTEGMVGIETVMTNPKASDMTLRDHFAGLAMQGAIACAFLSENVSEDDYAMWAYRYADAMMKERSK